MGWRPTRAAPPSPGTRCCGVTRIFEHEHEHEQEQERDDRSSLRCLEKERMPARFSHLPARYSYSCSCSCSYSYSCSCSIIDRGPIEHGLAADARRSPLAWNAVLRGDADFRARARARAGAGVRPRAGRGAAREGLRMRQHCRPAKSTARLLRGEGAIVPDSRRYSPAPQKKHAYGGVFPRRAVLRYLGLGPPLNYV